MVSICKENRRMFVAGGNASDDGLVGVMPVML